MKKLTLSFLILLILPTYIFSQELNNFSTVNTDSGLIKIPGKWEQLNKSDDSGQTFLKNENNVIIAIAENPMKSYPFFKSNNSDFENVASFYNWDSEYRKENNFVTKKLKENSELKYIIWKYNDGKLDNIYLFGSVRNNFTNFLVYTKIWTEEEQMEFLENLYNLNK